MHKHIKNLPKTFQITPSPNSHTITTTQSITFLKLTPFLNPTHIPHLPIPKFTHNAVTDPNRNESRWHLQGKWFNIYFRCSKSIRSVDDFWGKPRSSPATPSGVESKTSLVFWKLRICRVCRGIEEDHLVVGFKWADTVGKIKDLITSTILNQTTTWYFHSSQRNY